MMHLLPGVRSLAAHATLAGTLAVLGACGGDRAPPDTTARARDVRISIERMPCFGRCPIYRIEMDSAGRVTYDGKGFVTTTGRQEATISRNDVQALARELEDAGYFDFRDNYPADATDHATVVTTLTIDGRTKRVEHDLSSRSAPSQLERLEERIDEIARSARWVGAEPSTGAPASKRTPGDTSRPR